MFIYFGRKLLDTYRINHPYQVTLRYAYQYCLASIDMNGHEHSNQNGLMGNLFICVIKKESKRFFPIFSTHLSISRSCSLVQDIALQAIPLKSITTCFPPIFRKAYFSMQLCTTVFCIISRNRSFVAYSYTSFKMFRLELNCNLFKVMFQNTEHLYHDTPR